MGTLKEILNVISEEYKKAVKNNQHLNYIRSQKLIGHLHSYVSEQLKSYFNEDWILNEQIVYGFPKKKKQDVVVVAPKENFPLTGPLAVINLRSQLSSIEKNYDTLFERLFAEALNIHNRFPYCVLSYVYLLPHKGFNHKTHSFDENYNLEKYLLSFLSISERLQPEDEKWKYEKIWLLIVDFQSEPIKILTMNDLIENKMISERFLNLFPNVRNFLQDDFFEQIYKLTLQRFYLIFNF